MDLNETEAPRRIAVIGGGISGMAAAHLLGRGNRVTLFEAEGRLGGHARTVLAGRNGDQPVDTGFIVFNEVNYPHLRALFHALDVPVAKSDMSFGASFDGGRFEYGLRDLTALCAQWSNLADPRFLRMVRDILRFNARAEAAAEGPDQTIADLLRRIGTGAWFRDRYLLPLSGAIWSTPASDILGFPARALVGFFRNHALLHHSGQHQWYTVRGGSVEYVRRLEASLRRDGVELRLGAAIGAVRRRLGRVEIVPRGGVPELFDEVIFATHSDDALRLLTDPRHEERAALSSVRYQTNRAVLHSDAGVMPRRRAAWASWCYTEERGREGGPIDLTYWMNSLQPIPMDDPLFVTLNDRGRIDPAKVFDEVGFRHPVYDRAALAGQAQVAAFNGRQSTWYCGAWMRNGFHEDGFASAVDVVEAMAGRELRQVAAQ